MKTDFVRQYLNFDSHKTDIAINTLNLAISTANLDSYSVVTLYVGGCDMTAITLTSLSSPTK